MTQAVKRACDACHRRKVKCDGLSTCKNCSAAGLACTYNAIPQKKGPKGSRAKVISELRENQRQTSLSAKVQSRINGSNGMPLPDPGLNPSPGLLSPEFVKECVNFYFDHLYPQIPILNRDQMEHYMRYMEQNRDSYCLLTSLCAFIMLQPGMNMPPNDPYNLDMNPGAPIVASQLLLEEALRVRKGSEYSEAINFDVVATSFFIYGCYYGLELHDRAWFYLREGVTMIELANWHNEESYAGIDVGEAARRRRLYWLFALSERAYGVHRRRTTTLESTIRLPTVGDDSNDPYAHRLNDFITLVNLYSSFNQNLIRTWNSGRLLLTAQLVTGMQKQVQDRVQTFQDPNLTALGTIQQWLSAFWPLANGNMSGLGDDSLSFRYPVEMARKVLAAMASSFPNQQNQPMDLLGSGLIEKLLQTSSVMIDFLSMQEPSRDPFTIGPHEYLNQLLSVLALLRQGDYRFIPLLLSKVSEVLPRLATPMLQNAPQNANLGGMDMFDGFGTAGIAQPPPQMQMQLPMDADYSQQQKFVADDYEKKFSLEDYRSMDMAGGTPDSAGNSRMSNGTPPGAQQASDMNGSFIKSPSMMSPGVDYSHNLNGFGCTPMSDMVMSPLGNSGQGNPMSGMVNQQHLPQQVGQVHDNHQAQLASMATQGMHNQGMNSTAMPTSHSMNGMYNVREARQSSFHMHGQQPMRTVGDFQGLQRAGSDTGQGMNGLNAMPNEMDFGAMR